MRNDLRDAKMFGEADDHADDTVGRQHRTALLCNGPLDERSTEPEALDDV